MTGQYPRIDIEAAARREPYDDRERPALVIILRRRRGSDQESAERDGQRANGAAAYRHEAHR